MVVVVVVVVVVVAAAVVLVVVRRKWWWSDGSGGRCTTIAVSPCMFPVHIEPLVEPLDVALGEPLGCVCHACSAKYVV